jgi:hypothetical protein
MISLPSRENRMAENGLEFRVVWKREGQSRKRKLYQTRAAAESFVHLLRTSSSEEPPYDYDGSIGYPDGQWERMTATLVEGPVLESRPVGEWVAAQQGEQDG